MLALPIFPGRCQPSIVGASELNFCVRNGNRWTLTAISTNYFACCALKTEQRKSFLLLALQLSSLLLLLQIKPSGD